MDVQLNTDNFFRYYMFHTRDQRLSRADSLKVRITSIVLGIFTLGIVHLICRIAFYDRSFSISQKKLLNSDKKLPESPQQESGLNQAKELPLLTHGKARQGTGEGEKVDLLGITIGNITTIETDKLMTAAFATCFHTNESKQEIFDLIGSIHADTKELRGGFGLFKIEKPKKPYQLSLQYIHLMNNLIRLHHKLPGQSKAKEVKIYWNERAEKILIPYLLENEQADLDDLVFTVLSGDKENTPFQAEKWDPSQQLQFVGIGKKKIFEELCKKANLNQKRTMKSDNPLVD